MLDVITGMIIGGAVVYFWNKPGTNIVAAKSGEPAIDKKRNKPEKPLLDLPYFKYKHIRPPSEPEWYTKGTYDGVAICQYCYRTTHKMTDSWPGDCPDCGTSYSCHQDVAAKWLPREGKWLISPTSENPYPVPREYPKTAEKDITPRQKELQDNR
ncbi:MAG: hypothetical protein JXR12_06385 [Neptunomonas phycophila]|uniref:hypothetical protein n=1 Tax=Neptunomonas phycophila TaxID=1572645 RepID=UPI003B8B0F72